MTCETPVNSPLYVDTATCISSSSLYNRSGHSYVRIGNLNASDLMDSCSIELMTMITSRHCTKDMNTSYIDIHNELVYGSDLNFHGYTAMREIQDGVLVASTMILTMFIVVMVVSTQAHTFLI